MKFSTRMLNNLFKKMTAKSSKANEGKTQETIREEMIAHNKAMDTDCLVPSKKTKDITISKVSLNNCTAWLFTKEQNKKDKIIYYIHGGGFTGGSTKERLTFVSYIVNKFKYNVFSIDYRLAPEFMHPCAINDCFNGYEYLLKTYDPNNIVFFGESAGGNLVLSLGLLIKDKSLPLPKAICSSSPVTQFSGYTDSYYKFSKKTDYIVTLGALDVFDGCYYKEEEKETPYISPLYGNLKGLPPIYLDASDCESLLDDSVKMNKNLVDQGVEVEFHIYKGMLHASDIVPQISAVRREIYPNLYRFINKYLG